MLTGIAHKRGAQVFLCACDSYGSVPNSTARRVIQYEVRQIAHHNLVIFSEASAATSVWQWAEWHTNERTPRVYEHTALKSAALGLVERLRHITFSLEDEETLDILDVAGRLEGAFGDSQSRKLRGRHKRAGLAAYDLAEMDAGIRYWWERVLSEPRLTSQQERQVVAAIRRGNVQAVEIMVRAHLHLVARIALRIATKYELSLDDHFDLMQAGNVELVRITPAFDPGDGVHFQTYVTWRVTKALLRSLNGEEGFIPLPRYILDSLPNVVQQRRILEEAMMQDCGHCVSDHEVEERLAAQYGMEHQTFSRVLAVLGGVSRLDDEDIEGIAYQPVDIFHPHSDLVFKDTVTRMLSALKPRECEVVKRRFGLSPYVEQTLEEMRALLA